ncbi:MAG: hypothetical protein M3T96_00900 [Acidobacteriota bacterium]|nr:hypothetical protein [Acidobacteriota bacterium]
MRKQNLLKRIRLTLILSILVCGALIIPNEANAQFNKLKDKVKKAVNTTTDNASQTTDDADNSGGQDDRDTKEVIDDAYVYYVSQIQGFDPHYYGIEQVKREAKEHAAKLEAALKANPSYRNRKMGTYLRDETVQMTAAELLDKLNRAEEIISGNKADRGTQNMSYFVQGDVDDWKNRMDKLDANDGFILLADYEYPLLFNREAGEREALAKYSKGNGGQPLPASVITPLHNQISELLAKMNADASNYSFSSNTAKQVEPAIFSSIVKQAPENIPGATVLRTAWLPGEWIIDKNDLGVPVLRRRPGTALYRVPNQKFCVEQHFFYHEQYTGGGKYQRGADVNFSDLRFVNCQ